MKKRILSILLAVVLLATALPLTALSVSAEEVVPLTVAQAVELGTSQEHNTYTADKYYVTGEIVEYYSSYATYGNMYIADTEGNRLLVYGMYNADGTVRYDAMDVKPVIGDTITVYGVIGQYNNNPQMKNGWLTAHVPAGGDTPDVPDEPCTHEYDNACDKSCNICDETRTVAGHTYKKVITKATLTKDGKIKNVCTECGYTSSKVTTLYKASKIALSKTIFSYNGKAQKPSVVVKDSKGNKISSSYYTVKYASGRKNVGTYKVTVTFKTRYSGKKTLTYSIAPTTRTKATVVKGSTYKLGAKSNTTIKYASSNKKVATVSSKGVVTAVKAGTATITVKSGTISKKIKITVKNPSISISASKKSVYRGKKLQLKATVYPSSAKVTWSVNKKNIATVSKSGVVTGKKCGVVTVTAKITYKGKTYKDTYKVEVKVETPSKTQVFISSKTKYTDIFAANITNNGNKTLKILKRGYVYCNGEGSYVDTLFDGNGYVNSINVAPGKSFTFVYGLEEKLLFFESEQVIAHIYFEYDGELYYVKCNSDRFGLQKAYELVHLVEK